MSLPSANVIYMPPVNTYFVDKDTAQALSAGVVTFYIDNSTNLKPIYQVTEAPPGVFNYSVLPNPISLSSSGTFIDGNGSDINVYLYPFTGLPTDLVTGDPELYAISVYSSDGVFQESRSAWPPNVQAVANTISSIGTSINQVTNPQFVETVAASPAVYTVTGTATTLIAQGWYALTTGNGTITVSQVPITPSTNPPSNSNPPYALQIASSGGVLSLKIYQRFTASPSLLSGGYVYGSFDIASASLSGAQPISMSYEPSSGAATTIFSGLQTAVGGVYSTLGQAVAIPSDANTNNAPAGYVDLIITLTINVQFEITSVQLVGVSSAASVVAFQELSTPLQISQLYWYDQPNLFYKPIPSYLVGWDFPMNPCQILGPTPDVVTNGLVNNSYYLADQTILFQSVDASFSMAQGQKGFVITAANTSTFALIQYITLPQALDILNTRLSVALGIATSQSTLKCTVQLYWTVGTVPSIITPTFASLVSSVTAGPITTVAGGWTAVPSVLGGAFTLTAGSSINSIMLNGFDPTGVNTSTAANFAIVISFDTVTAANTVTIDYCSLNAGDIATRPAPQTADEVLRECQYYYETSYINYAAKGTATAVNQCVAPMGTGLTINGAGAVTAYGIVPSAFGFQWNTIKRKTPTLSLYSVTGTINNVTSKYYLNGALGGNANALLATYWSVSQLGNKGFNYSAVYNGFLVSTGVGYLSPYIVFHYVANAQIGVVL